MDIVDIVDAVDIVDKRPSPPSSAGTLVPEIALIQRIHPLDQLFAQVIS